MTLRNIYPWIKHAQQHNYAVGAFNANTLEQMQAIVLAAQAEQAPAIIQVSHRALVYVGHGNATLGLQYMAAMGKIAAESVDVPVALHLDHASDTDVLQAIALGFTSVMFDGDELPFEQNITVTKALCEAAHDWGVCMEAEVGEVPKPDGTAYDPSEIALTRPEDAVTFAAATGVDTLAVALGSVHGLTEKNVTLDLDRLQNIRAQVDLPLVLHGSSGVTDHDIAAGIKLGLCKVNVATQLNTAFTGAVRASLNANGSMVDPRKYLGPGRDAQIEAVRERIRFIGASGTAAACGG